MREEGGRDKMREFEMREQGGYDPYIFTTYVTNLKLIHFLHFKTENVKFLKIRSQEIIPFSTLYYF